MSGPLAGRTVVELAGIGPVPFCCMLLADMGARVLRIDRKPGRAPTTAFEAALRNDGLVDRGRESIALDLRDPRGVAVAMDLVARADVLVEGFRPGVAERLGLGPDQCLARNPRLIYGRMTGWGQDGPLAQAAGHDLNYVALTGALHAMGHAGMPPLPPLNLVGDYGGGGMLLAFGIVAALVETASSNLGQVVDAAMVDGAALLMSNIYGLAARGVWTDIRASNMLDGAAPFYRCYTCADGGYVSVAALEPQFYRLLLGRCGLAGPDFEDQWDQAMWPDLRQALTECFLTRPRDEWCKLLEGTDACFAPVLSMSEAAVHPHNVARGTFMRYENGWRPAPAPRMSRTPAAAAEPAPRTGADTDSILAELGYSTAWIEELRDQGIAHGTNAACKS